MSSTNSSVGHAGSEKKSVQGKTAPTHTPQEQTPAAASALPLQRALSDPPAARADEILMLQHRYGNWAVQRLLTSHTVQPKLTVGPAGDRYEQEADRVADQVLPVPQPTSPKPAAQRQPQEEDELQAMPMAAMPMASGITPLVQREATSEEEEEMPLQRHDAEDKLQAQGRSTAEGFEAGSDFESQLQAARGGGRPLPDGVRGQMEAGFGADFSGVRVHAGPASAHLNRAVSAQAFTHGQDIYLGEGHSQLESGEGKRRLAHELTHVIQQTGVGHPRRAAGVAQRQDTIQRALPAATAVIRQCGPKSWKAGESAYDKVINGLTKWPSATTTPAKLAALGKIKTGITAWLAANATRTKKWDVEKRQHLRALEREVDLETYQVNQGHPIDPALRTAFTTKASTIAYVKAHPGDFATIAVTYDAIFPNNTLMTVLTEYFTAKFRAQPATATLGAKATLYNQCRDEIPVPMIANQAVNFAYRNVHGDPGFTQMQQAWRRTVGFSPRLIIIGQANATGVLGLVAANPGKVTEIEDDYNEVFAPAKFGALIFGHFVNEFKTHGNGAVFYAQQVTQYPPLDYLIKPAYRETFGETQLQTMLGQVKANALAAAVPDPTAKENVEALQAFMEHGFFGLHDFVPATGLGKFDATYNPKTGKLKITLKLAFDFKDFPTATVAPHVVGDFAQKTWDQTPKDQFILTLQTQVASIWSGKHTISCVRPGWATVVPPVQTDVEVREVPLGTQHFKITVQKGTVIDDSGQQKLKSGEPNSWVKAEESIAQLQQWDVKDKISDATIHNFLHQAEKTGNIDTAYKLDRKRVENVLKAKGRIAYARDQAATPVDAQSLPFLSQELARLVQFSKFSNQQKLHVDGAVAAGENPTLAAQRATHAQGLLAAAGYPLQVGTSAVPFAGVMITVPEDATIKAAYDAQWKRISAAHEAGHMLGLVDEYNAAASLEVVKKMISDGLLPPDTPADHLSQAGQGARGSHEAKQEGFMRLLNKAALSTPDFTQETLAKSTSIMTGGFDVMTQHYITIWEALTEMTKAHVDSQFWKIV